MKMMRLSVWSICPCLALCLLGLSQPTKATITSATELIEKAALFDGKIVQFQGEIIGDIMSRDQYVWLNINDGQATIGIWAAKDIMPPVKYTGEYRYYGDTILVTGKFHRACSQHGGDLDLHATEISLIAQGHEIEHETHNNKWYIAGILFIGIIALALLPWLTSKHARD